MGYGRGKLSRFRARAGSFKAIPLTMSLIHFTTEREAKRSKLGHICLSTKVPMSVSSISPWPLSKMTARGGLLSGREVGFFSSGYGLARYWLGKTRLSIARWQRRQEGEREEKGNPRFLDPGSLAGS